MFVTHNIRAHFFEPQVILTACNLKVVHPSQTYFNFSYASCIYMQSREKSLIRQQ